MRGRALTRSTTLTRRVGFLALIAEMRLPGAKRVLLPVVQFVLLYLLKTLYGIASLNALPPLLFSNMALMRLIGFNAHLVGHGLTRRGDVRRTGGRGRGNGRTGRASEHRPARKALWGPLVGVRGRGRSCAPMSLTRSL